jgi:hypothetical protein
MFTFNHVAEATKNFTCNITGTQGHECLITGRPISADQKVTNLSVGEFFRDIERLHSEGIFVRTHIDELQEMLKNKGGQIVYTHTVDIENNIRQHTIVLIELSWEFLSVQDERNLYALYI